MSDDLLPIAEDTAAAALHGSFCPKMCTFACPVTAATGRDDAVPWSFHRVVSDLAEGRRPPDGHTAAALVACSGCHACRVPCVFDQDVPAQIRAGRAAVHAAGASLPAVADAVARAAAGRSPFGNRLPTPPDGVAGATTVVVAGCRDETATLAALSRLLTAAGREVRFVVPDGCCGAALEDLGATGAAAERRDDLASRLADADRFIVTDPHTLPTVRRIAAERFGDEEGTARVVDAITALADELDAGRLALDGEVGTVTYHDPCLLARDEGVLDPPRRLLAAIGADLCEPEHHGVHTACSGAGLGLDLLDPTAAYETAVRRGGQLTATGAAAVTACGAARRRLADAGANVADLVVLLADHLTDAPPPPHQPPPQAGDPEVPE